MIVRSVSMRSCVKIGLVCEKIDGRENPHESMVSGSLREALEDQVISLSTFVIIHSPEELSAAVGLRAWSDDRHTYDLLSS